MHSLTLVILFALISIVGLFFRRNHKEFASMLATFLFINFMFTTQYLNNEKHYKIFQGGYVILIALVVFIVAQIMIYRTINKRENGSTKS